VKILVQPPVDTSSFTMENKESLIDLIKTRIEDGIKSISDGNS